MIKELLEKNKRYLFIGGLLFLLLFFMLSNQQSEIGEPILEEKQEVAITPTVLKVDVKGAVQKPGVYELEEGARVEDAIKKSGGLLDTASLSTINLSKKVEDEMVILVYTNEEIKSFLEEETRTLKQENTCVCPKIENQSCVTNPIVNYKNENNNTSKQVSLNSGTQADFESLPGIGSSKAAAIVLYRKEHGKFSSIEEIKNVSGIGEAIYGKIKNYLTL